MRVLHFLNTWLSQTMTWLYTQVVFLPPNVENHVICFDAANLDQFPISNFHCISGSKAWSLLGRTSWKFRLLWKYHMISSLKSNPHSCILHSHFGDSAFHDASYARRLNLNQVVSFYGYDVGRVPTLDPTWKNRYLELFQSVKMVFCEGPYLKQSLMHLGCPASKLRIQHLGVNLDRLPFRPRYWKTGEPLRILMAGSFVQKKGIPLGIEAVAKLRRHHNVSVTIIGAESGQSGSRLEKLRILDAIRSQELADQVHLLGYQPYSVLIDEAYRHHIFLAPSLTAEDGDCEGGAPVTIIDMAATGMPVVSTRHCDIPELILDGETGLLADERDVAGITERLEWLIAHPDRWHGMLQSARHRMETEFNARVQGQRLADAYREVISN